MAGKKHTVNKDSLSSIHLTILFIYLIYNKVTELPSQNHSYSITCAVTNSNIVRNILKNAAVVISKSYNFRLDTLNEGK